MTVLHDFAGWPSGALHLAIGVFDGVHVGHQALVRAAAERATSSGATALATTFDPLPIDVLAPGAPPSTLSDLDERCTLLEGAGAKGVVVFHFTPQFAAMGAEEFVRRLSAAGDVRQVSVGDDFQFGRGRGGNVRMLAELGATLGFGVEIASPVMTEGRVVSSTRIRNALLAGDVVGAAKLMGRRYAVAGSAEQGSTRGRALGFPTLDIGVPAHRLLPRDGIYAVWAKIGDKRVGAAASLGVRPTLGTGERRLEAYLLDRSGDLHADRVKVEFVARLRDELRFASATELAEQIAKDVEGTRKALRP